MVNIVLCIKQVRVGQIFAIKLNGSSGEHCAPAQCKSLLKWLKKTRHSRTVCASAQYFEHTFTYLNIHCIRPKSCLKTVSSAGIYDPKRTCTLYETEGCASARPGALGGAEVEEGRGGALPAMCPPPPTAWEAEAEAEEGRGGPPAARPKPSLQTASSTEP